MLKPELNVDNFGQALCFSDLHYPCLSAAISFALKVMDHVGFGFAAGCAAEAMPRR
jgi:hypothetical protein